jgi:hypothetical protein
MSGTNYIILEASELPDVEYDTIMEASENTLRHSLDGSKFLVKYRGSKPRWLYGKIALTHTQILAVLEEDDWRGEAIP